MKSKRNKKLSIVAKKAAKLLWRETIESVSFLLWLSTPPFTTKIFNNLIAEEFYPHQIRVNLNSLYRKGFISKIRKKKFIFFRIRKHPKEFFWPEYQLLKEKKFNERWEGSWWIIIYDIPEKIKFKRDALRIYIRNLGFAKLQGSCWVSPYDFSEQLHNFCNHKSILKYIYLYKASFFSGKDISKTVDEVWNLVRLKERYQTIIEELKEKIEILKIRDIDSRKHLREYIKLYKEYKNILNDDPLLPKEFIRRWPRDKLIKTFDQYLKLLSQKIKPNL